MRQYNSYHTTLKQLAKRESLPEIYVNQIDRSTLWRWKQEQTDKYRGTELNNIDVLEEFINRTDAIKVMRNYLKVASAISEIANRTGSLKNAIRLLT